MTTRGSQTCDPSGAMRNQGVFTTALTMPTRAQGRKICPPRCEAEGYIRPLGFPLEEAEGRARFGKRAWRSI